MSLLSCQRSQARLTQSEYKVMTIAFDRELEERLWALSTPMIAWRMFEEDEDFLFKGNQRIYEDIVISVPEEQFLVD